jgi:hypothetical protein
LESMQEAAEVINFEIFVISWGFSKFSKGFEIFVLV